MIVKNMEGRCLGFDGSEREREREREAREAQVVNMGAQILVTCRATIGFMTK